TRLNEEDKVLIGETIYDHQGRPAIEVLPVPHNKQNIGYLENFNRNSSGDAYGKEDFESGNANCATASPMQSGQRGAAHYYSPDNSDKSDQQAFLPDAQGYPFVHTQFTADNTGRVR